MIPDDHDSEENERSDRGFVRTMVSSLFETIAEMDDRDQRRRSASGRARRGDTRFDYGFDIGIGPGTETRTGGREAESDTDYAASVQPAGDGYVVTLDLPDVDPRELAAGVDGNGRLVVADEERVLERVSLPEGDLHVGEASFNNGVLDVRLDREDDA